MGTFRAEAQGQIADWEGGKVTTGTVTGGTSATQFAADNITSDVGTFYDGRVIEFKTGTAANIGATTIVTTYTAGDGSKDFVVSPALPATPAASDTFDIRPVANPLATTDISDGTDWITVWAWQNGENARGLQTRFKFVTPYTASVAASASTNSRVTITDLDIHVSLAYSFAAAANQGSSLLGLLLADWVSESALIPSGTELDDAHQFAKCRVRRDGEAIEGLGDFGPSSELIVPVGQIDTFYRPSTPLRRGSIALPDKFEFRRRLRYPLKLAQPITVSKDDTFDIQMKLTQSNASFEYDVVLQGVIS